MKAKIETKVWHRNQSKGIVSQNITGKGAKENVPGRHCKAIAVFFIAHMVIHVEHAECVVVSYKPVRLVDFFVYMFRYHI